MKQHILLVIIIGAAVAGCGVLPASPTPTVETPPTEARVPTETPAPTEPSPTPTAEPAPPTAAPAFTPWPLSADLFYLNDAGQVWRQSRHGDDSAVATITRLDVVVTDFSVAPGGTWIAYRTAGTVFAASLDGRSGQVIAQNVGTPPDTSLGSTIAWSPDGTKLAYVVTDGFQVYTSSSNGRPVIYEARELPIVDMQWSDDGLWLLLTRGDGASLLYEVTDTLTLWTNLGALAGADWLPDGRLAFTPTTGGVALLQPEDLNSRTFLVPENRAASLPHSLPDGSLRFFLHAGERTEPGALHTANPDDLSFSAESAFTFDTSGWRWNPTGTRLIRREGIDMVQMIDPLNGAPATFRAAGIPTSLQWGDIPPVSVEGAELPNDLFYLAPQAGIVQVWRLPASGGPPEVITNAEQNVVDFDVAPAGTQIAYTSGAAIFRQVIGTVDVGVLVELAEGVTAGAPQWSSDGTRVAYNNSGIWIHDLESGEDRRLIRDETASITGSERRIQLYQMPRWSPNGQWLLVDVVFFEGYDIALMPVTEFGVVSTPIPLELFDVQAAWLETNQIVAYGGSDSTAITVITPGEERNDPPTVRPLLDLPIRDVTLRPEDARVVLLRAPGALTAGPTSVSLVTVEGSGADPQQETGIFVIDDPDLSPDATTIAGLANVRIDEFGVRSGQITIVDVQTGERVIIADVTSVLAIQWGP